MVESNIRIIDAGELDSYFNIVESFEGIVMSHSINLNLCFENVNNIGDNLIPLEDYFTRARNLGYTISVNQLNEIMDNPFIVTSVTFSHSGIAGLIKEVA